MRTLIVVNPKAREGAVGQSWSSLERRVLEALGEKSAQVAWTTEDDHGSARVRSALRDGVKRIVTVGGDGTVSECVQGFFDESSGAPLSRDAVLAVFPAGRGDDFFKSLCGREFYSSGGAWDLGLELLRSGSPRPCDVGKVEFRVGARQVGAARYFINVASFGYPGLVVQRVAQRTGFWGRSRVGRSAWTYLVQSTLAMKDYRPVEATVVADGESLFSGSLFSGFLLNGRYNAGGVCWSKGAVIDDGKIDVVVSEPRGLLDTVLTAPRMRSGDWAGVRGIRMGRAQVIEIETRGERAGGHPLFELDGDLVEPPGTTGARVTTLAGAIRVWARTGS